MLKEDNFPERMAYHKSLCAGDDKLVIFAFPLVGLKGFSEKNLVTGSLHILYVQVY